MSAELVTASQILAGTGAAAWVVDKLLGPSAEGLGEQIKMYAGSRLTAIFSRIAELTGPDNVPLLEPALAVEGLRKASLSEEDVLVTDMWARLLLNSSENSASKSLIFADILSQLSANEANILNEISLKRAEHDSNADREIYSLEASLQSLEFFSEPGRGFESEDATAQVYEVLLTKRNIFPTSLRFIEFDRMHLGFRNSMAFRSDEELLSLGVLARQGLLARRVHQFTSNSRDYTSYTDILERKHQVIHEQEGMRISARPKVVNVQIELFQPTPLCFELLRTCQSQ